MASVPPVVVKTTPQSGAKNVSTETAVITVTFSKEMKNGSWTWSTLGEENFPKTTGKPNYLADKKTCVLHVHLQPGKTYAIWVNSDRFHNFQDAAGHPAVPYLLVFQTRP